MIDYDTFPMKRFFKILENPSLLKDYQIDVKDWNNLKEQWNEKHPTTESIKLTEAHRKVIIEGLKIQRNINLFKALITHSGDHRELFKVVGIKYNEDPIKRVEGLKKEIKKSEQKLKIFNAQRDLIEKDVKTPTVDEREGIDINEVMASFELHGFTINDYETFPMGRYDAYTKVISKKEVSNG